MPKTLALPNYGPPSKIRTPFCFALERSPTSVKGLSLNPDANAPFPGEQYECCVVVTRFVYEAIPSPESSIG